jgi:hypothetical protein
MDCVTALPSRKSTHRMSSNLPPPLPSMAGDDVLLHQLHFLTLIFPQLMQYHASHAMTGLEEGGGRQRRLDMARGSTTSWMVVGLKLAEEGLIMLFLGCDSTLHEPAIA